MQPLKLQGVSATRLGQEVIVKSLIQEGKPLTRANYLDAAALDPDEMTPELEAMLPDEFQLTEEGEDPPEVILEFASSTSLARTRSSKMSPLERWEQDYDSLMEEGEMAKYRERLKEMGLKLS